MFRKSKTELWKLILFPIITFIIVFGVSRSLIPLLKDWTWKATLVGCALGIAAAFLHFVMLFFSKE